jgi:Fe-S-cluster containining protein
MSDEFQVVGDDVYKLVGSCQPSLCRSWCCQHMVFTAPKTGVTDDRYYSLHGCAVKETAGGFAVLVPAVCTGLDRHTGKCIVYETRPAICRNYARHPQHRFKSEYCSLRWKLLTGREKQVAMKKLRRCRK